MGKHALKHGISSYISACFIMSPVSVIQWARQTPHRSAAIDLDMYIKLKRLFYTDIFMQLTYPDVQARNLVRKSWEKIYCIYILVNYANNYAKNIFINRLANNNYLMLNQKDDKYLTNCFHFFLYYSFFSQAVADIFTSLCFLLQKNHKQRKQSVG